MSAPIESILSFILNGLWRATWQASALAVVVLVIQRLLGKNLGGRGRFALWAVVVVRLLLPVLPESRVSVFNLAKSRSQPISIAPAQHDAEIPVIVINPLRSAKPPAAERALMVSKPKRQIHWSAWIFAAWVAGVLTLLLRVAHVCWDLSRMIRKLASVEDERLLEMLRSCGRLLHLRRLPIVVAGENVHTPAVVGLFRAKLLLPSHVLSACDDREIRLIFLHELAHLKRRDIAGNWLIALASIVHWFNPAVWFISARMRADRELACDEMVLTASSGEAKAYGQTLVKLVEILSPKVRALAVSPRELAIVGILESSTPMQRRVRMIAQFDPKQSRRWIWTILVLGALGCMTLTDAVKGEKATTRPTSQPAAQATQDQPALEHALDKQLAEVKFDQTPLSDVMDFIRDQSGVNLVVNWRALEAAGIDRNGPVSIRLKNVTLRQAMDHVLADAGGGIMKLGYTIAEGAILVSTEEDLATHTVTAAYDVSDLIRPEPNLREASVEGLLKLVQKMVEPASWKNDGGTVGDISELNGKLVVQNTQEAQKQVAELLKLLRTQQETQKQQRGGGGGEAFLPAPSAPHTVVADEELERANQQAMTLLHKKLPEIKFQDVALTDVVDFFRDVSNGNFSVNWKALQHAGIDKNTAVAVRLHDTTLQTALAAIARDLNPQQVVLVIDHGVIVLTTRMDLPSYMITKTYDVKDLAQGNDVAKLADVVRGLMHSELGSPDVQSYGTKLIVTALPEAHEQVEKLLADLKNNPTTQAVK